MAGVLGYAQRPADDQRVGESVTIASTGTNIVVAVPTRAALEEAGWQPEDRPDASARVRATRAGSLRRTPFD
jgi:hypothetical protein